jgi:hypothetical protein
MIFSSFCKFFCVRLNIKEALLRVLIFLLDYLSEWILIKESYLSKLADSSKFVWQISNIGCGEFFISLVSRLFVFTVIGYLFNRFSADRIWIGFRVFLVFNFRFSRLKRVYVKRLFVWIKGKYNVCLLLYEEDYSLFKNSFKIIFLSLIRLDIYVFIFYRFLSTKLTFFWIFSVSASTYLTPYF